MKNKESVTRLLLAFSIGAAAAVSTWAAADTYPVPAPGQSMVGEKQWVHAQSQDNLSDLARRFDLGYDAIVEANPTVDPWLPGQGTVVKLPMRHILPDAPRNGIVLNLAGKRLYYYPKKTPGRQAMVITHPVGIGRRAWDTPLGRTHVTLKIKDPAWYPPASIRKEHAKEGEPLPKKVPPGPDNPLGHYALKLALPQYFIHGTNKPYGIGMRVSHGCIRLYPEDIARLFGRVPKGTPVVIVNQPYKVGWSNGRLYLQVYPPFSQNAQPAKANKSGDRPTLVRKVKTTAKEHEHGKIDWQRVRTVARQARGIPAVIAAK